MSVWSNLVGAIADRACSWLADNLPALEPVPAAPEIGLEWAGRERGWMGTYSGRKFYPLAPLASDVELADIAHGLAMTCRYGGQCVAFYSVAEHCVLVSYAVEAEALAQGVDPEDARRAALEGLLHDSAEAYIGDMIRPLKHQPEMVEFRRAEAAIETAVAEAFGLEPTSWSQGLVKQIDDGILVDEIRALMRAPHLYLDTPTLVGRQPLGVRIHGWQPAHAEGAFISRYRMLGGAGA